MRIRLKQILLLSALLLTAVFSVAQSLDIVVEGPWIYYEKHTIPGSGTEPVVVLMAPKVGEHHLPTFSAGDGYQLDPGVYCLSFSASVPCAPSVQPSNLVENRAYDPEKRVRVHPGTIWNSRKHQLALSNSAEATFIILPIPDSLSNDGVYPMKFGTQMENYTAVKQQSVGLQLHYLNGPKVIMLSHCDSVDASTCHHDYKYQDQDNSGTLHITIKACGDPDEETDKCDNHVRAAYHAMILFLDDTDKLSLGKNANQDKGYIDLPPFSKACYASDPQRSDDMPAMTGCKHQSTNVAVALELKGITQQLSDPAKTHGLDTSQLFISQLTKLSNALDEHVPRFSELSAIATYLDLSAKSIYDQLEAAKSKSVDQAGKTQELPAGSGDNNYPKALAVSEANLALEMHSPTSGKDCKVTQMLLQLP
jgi:hypothetical protein